jgi:hypothetical protein
MLPAPSQPWLVLPVRSRVAHSAAQPAAPALIWQAVQHCRPVPEAEANFLLCTECHTPMASAQRDASCLRNVAGTSLMLVRNDRSGGPSWRIETLVPYQKRRWASPRRASTRGARWAWRV